MSSAGHRPESRGVAAAGRAHVQRRAGGQSRRARGSASRRPSINACSTEVRWEVLDPGGGPGAGSIDATGLTRLRTYSGRAGRPHRRRHRDARGGSAAQGVRLGHAHRPGAPGRSAVPRSRCGRSWRTSTTRGSRQRVHRSEQHDGSSSVRSSATARAQVDWRVDGALQAGETTRLLYIASPARAARRGHDRGAESTVSRPPAPRGSCRSTTTGQDSTEANGGEDMGDVDVKQVKNIDPITHQGDRQGREHDPLRIEDRAGGDPCQGAEPIDPITVESLGWTRCGPRSGQDRPFRRHASPDREPQPRGGARPRPRRPALPTRSRSACTRSSSCRRST